MNPKPTRNGFIFGIAAPSGNLDQASRSILCVDYFFLNAFEWRAREFRSPRCVIKKIFWIKHISNLPLKLISVGNSSPHLCVGFCFWFRLLPPAASRPHATYSHTTCSHTTCSHTTCSHTTYPHTSYSHTTLSHTTLPTHTHNLLTHHSLTHNCAHTQLTHVHTQLSLTQLSHTQLTHTQLAHTQLAHTQLAHTHTTYSHTQLAYTHNSLTYSTLSYNSHTHTTYSHTTLAHTHTTHTELTHTQHTHTHTHLMGTVVAKFAAECIRRKKQQHSTMKWPLFYIYYIITVDLDGIKQQIYTIRSPSCNLNAPGAGLYIYKYICRYRKSATFAVPLMPTASLRVVGHECHTPLQ